MNGNTRYEASFAEHRSAHPGAYQPIGIFPAREKIRIGSRSWDVEDIRACGMSRQSAILLFG